MSTAVFPHRWTATVLRAAIGIACAAVVLATPPAPAAAGGTAVRVATPGVLANGLPPVDARNDAVTVRAITPSAIAVLGNDLGGNPAGGAPLRITALTGASKGRVTTDGTTVTYDPTGCSTGSDLFTYTITNGTTVDTASVVVTISRPSAAPVSDAPTLGFLTGSTMSSTVPMRLAWCGVSASGTSVRSYRVDQSTNGGSTWPTTLYGKTVGTSTTRAIAVSTSYEWRVRTTDSRGRTGSVATSLVSRVTRYQDSSTALHWSTGWSVSRSSSYSGGTERATTRAGASVTLHLTNVRAFAVVASKAAGRGSFRVYVDGVLSATISERATSASWRRVLYTRALTSGAGVAHTIEIRAVGNGRIDLDAILTLSGKRDQAITFTTVAPASATVGGATYAVAARATSGYPVSLSIDPSAWSVCSIAGSTVSFNAVGTCVVNANQSGDATWNAAPRAQQSFAVAGTAQSITFDALSARTYGDAPFDVAATASSGLAVAFASTTGTVCSVSGATVTILAAGDCTIRATQAGDAVYAPATPVDRTFTAARKDLTVTFSAADRAYDGGTVASITGCDLVGVVGTDDVTCDASGATGSFATAAAGVDKTVTGTGFALTGTAAANYAIGTVETTTATISAADQAITFTSSPPVGQAVGGPTYEVTATATSGLTVTFTIDASASAVCSISGSTVSSIGAGTCVIDANQAGDGNWNAAPQVQQSFGVGLNAQSITFDLSGLPSKTYGDVPFAISATASSGLTVAFASTTGTVCSVSGTNVTILAGGDCTIQASQAGDATWAPAPSVSQTVTVAKATLTVTASSPAAGVYGDAAPTITPGYSGFVGSDGAGSLATAPTCSTVYVQGDAPGDYATSCSGGVSGSYAFTYVPGSFHVAKASQSITFGALSGRTYGDAPFTVSATATSGLTVAFASTTGAVCSVAGTTVTILAAGDCTIRATQPGNGNWNAATPVDRTFTVAPLGLTVTGITANDKTYDGTTSAVLVTTGAALVGVVGTDDVTLDASAATGAFTPDANAGVGKTVQVAGLALAGAASGDYTLTQPTTTATISKANADCSSIAGYTVTWDGDSHAATGDCLGVDGVTVLAGLDRSGTSHTAVGVYLADPWTFTDVTGNYHDTSGTVDDTINPQAQVITFDPLAGATYGDAPVDISASTSSGLPITFSSADTAVCTVATGGTVAGVTSGTVTILAAGTCTIHADAAAGGNYAAATRVTRSFTVAQRAITVTAVTDTRAYDGTTASSGVPTVTAGSLATGDTGAFTQTFDTASIGTGKTLTPTGTVSHGVTDVTASYTITWVPDTTGVITFGPADHFVVTAASPQVIGVAFAFTVTAVDAFDNTVTDYVGTIHVTSSDLLGGVLLPPDYTFTGGDNGSHTFLDGATLLSLGDSTITATDTVVSALTGTSNLIHMIL